MSGTTKPGRPRYRSSGASADTGASSGETTSRASPAPAAASRSSAGERPATSCTPSATSRSAWAVGSGGASRTRDTDGPPERRGRRAPNAPVRHRVPPCGVFGVWAPGEEVAKLTYFGLYALQHRGQEAAGIAVSDGASVVVYKDLGLVSQVFEQPTLGTTSAGTGLALCHNGNLVNTAELASKAADAGVPGAFVATNDSDLVTALIAARPDLSVEE